MSTNICERLCLERERLGKTQEEFALIAGVTRRPYVEWERGTGPYPSAQNLARLAAVGADVLYIITGQRSQPITPQELLPEGDRIFLDNLHAAPAEVQRGVKITLDAFAPHGGADASTHHRSRRKSA